MYYQPNQYQNQYQNYPQNYTAPVAQSPGAVMNPNQYQYPGYPAPQNPVRGQPQYPKTHPTQNVQQIQNVQNYQNVPQVHQHNNAQRQQPPQAVQYVQAPGQPNTYSQYAQPVQQVYGQQPQQVHQMQGQNMKQNYNMKTYQDPNLVKNMQVANQMVQQPQNQKMIFKAPNPKGLAASHKQSVTAPTLPPSGAQQLTQTEIGNEKNLNQNSISLNQHLHQNNAAINQTALPVENINKVEPKLQMQQPGQNDKKAKKTASFMTVNSLAVLPYKNYPQVEFSSKPFLNISGYGSNSYNGKIKNYNEDKIKIQYKVSKNYIANDGKQYQALISYFGVFDGHGGENCSKFLKKNLDGILFNQSMFPNNVIESVRETFNTAERSFKQFAVQKGALVDKSGSCACIALIINDLLYSINLGDSRALYSYDGGKEYYQLTRDHKPDDPKERARIEKAGGKVYYANKTIVNGVEVTLREEQFGPGFKFPYRLAPSGLAVRIFYNNFYFYYIYRL